MVKTTFFEPSDEVVTIPIPTAEDPTGGPPLKKSKDVIEAAVWHAVGKIQREYDGSTPGTTLPGLDSPDSSRRECFLRLNDTYFKMFITRDALEDRLWNPDLRESDYDSVNSDSDARPIEMWNQDGELSSIPQGLIPVMKPYDDNVQRERWVSFARNLVKKHHTNVNPTYARFLLKPSDKLKIKVYFTPSDKRPVCNIDVDKLRHIIDLNKDRFSEWPSYEVITFEAARQQDLKLIGHHFLQFYFTWMSVEHYKALWQEFYEGKELYRPYPSPAESTKPPDTVIKADVGISESKRIVDGAAITITSKKIGAAWGERRGQNIMGKSATVVARDLGWTDDSGTKMSRYSAEWLHRTAFCFGGLEERVSLDSSNDPANLVFGSAECNTHMIRVENTIYHMTRKDRNITGRRDEAQETRHYEGKLTTRNRYTGAVERMTWNRDRRREDIPRWVDAKKYSWLCFCLEYTWEMPAESSPLNCTFNATTEFDPWSVFVPLQIEPRLDDMIFRYLKDERRREGVHRVVPSLLGHSSLMTSVHVGNAATDGLPILERSGVASKSTRNLNARPPPNAVPHRLGRSNQQNNTHSLSPSSFSTETSSPSSSGFVLQGETQIFGSTIVGLLETWQGDPPPVGGTLIGTAAAVIERVTLSQDFHISALIPELQDTLFDQIIFRNVVFYHQNGPYDATKPAGWHFNADCVIASCGPLHQVLTNALQVDRQTLSIHAYLGEQQVWNSPLSLHSFTLDGVFHDLTISPIPRLQLSSIGVRLLGIRGFSHIPKPHSTLSFGFSLYGTMKLDVPGSVTPLDLDYEMRMAGKTVQLSAEISGQIWENPLGAQNVLLSDIMFTTTFAANSPWKTFEFDVSAKFKCQKTDVFLTGSYGAHGDFALTARLENFSIQDISDIFKSLYYDSLTFPNLDITIGSATLELISGRGLAMALQNVKVASHIAVNARLSFTSSGATMYGDVSGDPIAFGDMKLRHAQVQLSFWRSSSQKQAAVTLGGTLDVDFLNLEITAIAHLYTSGHGIEWVVVAELSTPSRRFALSQAIPEMKGTFLDLSLNDALFIASSIDEPSLNVGWPTEYCIRQGIQVIAVIDGIGALDALFRRNTPHLTISVGWSKVSGFHVSMALPAEMCLDFGNGIRTTPVSLGVRTNPVELALTAGLTVPTQDPDSPLTFNIVVAASATGASAASEMKGWWTNPCGIANLKIGPVVSLSIEIIYAQFMSTGTPSGFGIAGGLMIGHVQAHLAMNVSEDPRREMLSGQLMKLDISDVILLTQDLVQQDIPQLPKNLLRFEDVVIYICPAGIIQGTTSYPQGFSFTADLIFLGKRFNVQCRIDSVAKSIFIQGGVDNFELGPLSVRGSRGRRAELNGQIGPTQQHVVINGMIAVFNIEAQAQVDVQLWPKPVLNIYLSLRFADIFNYQLNAQMVESPKSDSPVDADFVFRGSLENNILEYISQQVREQLQAASVAASHGLDAALDKVKEDENAWNDTISNAEREVERTRNAWKTFEHETRLSSQPIIDNYLAEISRLKHDVENARTVFHNAIEDARRAVEKANHDRAAALAAAKRDVDSAERDKNRGMEDAQRALDAAKADLAHAFGDARRAIDNAQRDVWSLQRNIDDVKATIHDYDHAPWYEFWKKAAIAGLWVTVGSLEASKAVASGMLDAARGVLHGSEHVAKEGAVESARLALEAAKDVGSYGLIIAQGALTVADESSRLAVDRANETLRAVQTGPEYVAFQAALTALEAFESVNKAAYEAAVAAIDGLMDSAASLAFAGAKASLQVAKSSIASMLAAAEETLRLTEQASQNIMHILQDLASLGEHAINIQSTRISGTLRGVLGIEGMSSNPLLADVKGYVIGQPFAIQCTFDLGSSTAFIISIFRKIWELLSASLPMPVSVSRADTGLHVSPAAAPMSLHGRGPMRHRALTNTHSESLQPVRGDTMVHIPRGSFKNAPVVPSHVLAEVAANIMKDAKNGHGSHD